MPGEKSKGRGALSRAVEQTCRAEVPSRGASRGAERGGGQSTGRAVAQDEQMPRVVTGGAKSAGGQAGQPDKRRGYSVTRRMSATHKNRFERGGFERGLAARSGLDVSVAAAVRRRQPASPLRPLLSACAPPRQAAGHHPRAPPPAATATRQQAASGHCRLSAPAGGLLPGGRYVPSLLVPSPRRPQKKQNERCLCADEVAHHPSMARRAVGKKKKGTRGATPRAPPARHPTPTPTLPPDGGRHVAARQGPPPPPPHRPPPAASSSRVPSLQHWSGWSSQLLQQLAAGGPAGRARGGGQERGWPADY